MSHICMLTKRQRNTGTCDWIIEDFDTFFTPCMKSSPTITSDLFHIGKSIGKSSKWSIGASVKDGKFGVRLNLEEFNSKKNKDFLCECTFEIGCAHQTLFKPLITHNFYYPFTDLEGYGPPELITIRDLFSRKEEFIPGNAIQIRLYITILSDPKSSSLSSTLLSSQEELLSKSLADSFEQLFLSQKHSDLQLICQGRTFYVHKAILSARSPTFASILEESSKHVVTVDDVSEETMEIILKFIYTGDIKLPASVSEWDELLVAIDTFQLSDLKDTCFAVMASCIDDDNAAKFALNAYKFKASNPTRKIIVDYCQTRFAVLMKNPQFKQVLLESPQAFAED